jgi:tRNA threonylcarbamoyladenosine biosynthesis protein TsaB
MKLLALETSTHACSVAVQYGDRLFERHVVRAKEHTRLLIPMIEEALLEGGASLGELDAIVLGNGPGSFIGMRIGASVAQGLAYGARLGIVPVSSLAAVAAEAFHLTEAEYVMVAQDAHMSEVYLACFRRGEGGLPVPDGETTLQPIRRIERFAGVGAGRIHVAGGGWPRHPQLLQLNEDRIADVLDIQFPRASFLLGAGAAAFRSDGMLPPDQLVPDYVRSKVASAAAPAERNRRDIQL